MKKLSRKEEKKLTPEEYQEYYYYLRELYENSKINNISLDTRKNIHPLLLSIIKLRNRMNGYKLDIIDDKRESTNRPIIFAVTHIGKADIEVVSEAIKDHYYLLCGDFESLHDTVDGLFLGLNGVIYFNEKNKNDRKNVKIRMEETLKRGGNLLYFPEGTWNLTANLPLNNCYYGIIEVALNTNAIIIPIAIEQYDKKFIANVGNNFDVCKYDIFNEKDLKIQAISDLRDELATLKWQIWESVPKIIRKELPDNYYEKFIDEKIGEWPTLTLKDFTDAIYKDKNVANQDEVFEPIKKLQYKKETAFLFKK